MKDFATQISQIRRGGYLVLTRKIKRVLVVILKSPLYFLAVPCVIVIRLIRPWLLVRMDVLVASRIGHFAANTELYCCERDAGINVPSQRHVDIFCISNVNLSNQQLALMWKRTLGCWPAWVLAPIIRVNRVIPGGAVHDIGVSTHGARDIYNLYDRTQPHLEFTRKEVDRGEAMLRTMGLPKGSFFICLNVRDSAYLDSHQMNNWSYHNFRDSEIDNYVLAAEELANRGYFVIRMGAKVHRALKSKHERVIDYATNGMRSDFMDIYLGAKCTFCISTGSGWDGMPEIFRRPTVFVNLLPLGNLLTFRRDVICITKHHYSKAENRELTLTEIFTKGAGFCYLTDHYDRLGVQLNDNTPEEIRDVAIEMAERLNGTWQFHAEDETLQQRFWELFPSETLDYRGLPLHGKICSRFGAYFLRNNREWLK